MAIPDRDPQFDVDPAHLTLNDWALFAPQQGDPAAVLQWVLGLRDFLVRHSRGWTAAEIGQLETADLPQVIEMLAKAMEAKAVPLASATPSATGRAAKKTPRRPAGS